jgi:hypothetical protein
MHTETIEHAEIVETEETIETRVRLLREAGLTPKLIARKLGLSQSTVGRVVAAMAAQRPPSDEVVGCWVSPGWSCQLVVAPDREWPVGDNGRTGTGIVGVLVARRGRHDKVRACGYLVDVYCLGVKNASGPRTMEMRDLASFSRTFFAAFDGEPVPAPLELAQHLVLGAVEYARGLGFEPHHDFAATAGHLGEWKGPSAITFGRDGTPLYVQGPYDNPFAIIQTLNRTVGSDNYHFVMAAA